MIISFQSRFIAAFALVLLASCAREDAAPTATSEFTSAERTAGRTAATSGQVTEVAGRSGAGAIEPSRTASTPSTWAGAGGATRGAGGAGPRSSTATNVVTGGAGAAGVARVVAGAGGAGGTGATAMAGAGGVAAGSGGSAAGAPAEACEKGVVKASDVVFIGESFIAATGDIPRFTSELAREAGTIGMNESYRSFAVSGTQLTTGDIPGQYTRAKAAAPVKVVLMDGGGNDLLLGGRCMDSVDAACREIIDVVDELFAQFKSDGVTDVVYFFYPDPMGIGAGIKEAMDILRPEMKKLCDETTAVRCVWVDQRESWEGHYDMYTSDGIHPTAEGSKASAQQIWDAMVANCIAQ